MEGAGVVTDVGDGVRDLKAGRRVAYAGPIGAYAEERLIQADRVVKIPANVSDRIAAAIMLKGMTAQYLVRRTYKVGPETTLLFHAAAGGVGLIACQWAASLGATVIGTVGSAGKALIAARPRLRPRHQCSRRGPGRQGQGVHKGQRRRCRL